MFYIHLVWTLNNVLKKLHFWYMMASLIQTLIYIQTKDRVQIITIIPNSLPSAWVQLQKMVAMLTKQLSFSARYFSNQRSLIKTWHSHLHDFHICQYYHTWYNHQSNFTFQATTDLLFDNSRSHASPSPSTILAAALAATILSVIEQEHGWDWLLYWVWLRVVY